MYLLVESHENGVAQTPIRLAATTKRDAIHETAIRFKGYKGRHAAYLYEMVPSGRTISIVLAITTCTNCESSDVKILDSKANELECQDCGTIYFL